MHINETNVIERTRKELTDNRPRLPHEWMANWKEASSYVFNLVEDSDGEKMILISFE
jgi:hypothetical protein